MGHAAFNNLTGENFRFRFDDAGEAEGEATFYAAQNANIELPVYYGNLRLRFGLRHFSDIIGQDNYLNMQMSIDGGAFEWIYDIGSGNESYIGNAPTTHYDNQDDVTEHSSDLFTGAFVGSPNGCLVSTGSFGRTANFIWGQSVLEGIAAEWCLRLIEDDISIGTTIDLKPFDNGTAFSNGWEQTARITIVGAPEGSVSIRDLNDEDRLSARLRAEAGPAANFAQHKTVSARLKN